MFPHAAKNGGDAQRQMPRIGADIFLDLHHQLTRRRDHQHANAAPRRGLGRKPGKDRERESRRFAGAGLCDADEVMSRQHLRDGRGLNRGGLSVSGLLDGL